MDSQTLPMNPVPPISRMCLPARAWRTERISALARRRWKSTTGGAGLFVCRAVVWMCGARAPEESPGRPSMRKLWEPKGARFGSGCRVSGMMGECSRPVASPSRNSSRLETRLRTPRCWARGRRRWSSSRLTQHYLVAVGAQPPYGLNPLGLEMVSQLVLEIFFTQQVQAVPAGAPQRQVDQVGWQAGDSRCPRSDGWNASEQRPAGGGFAPQTSGSCWRSGQPVSRS